MGGDSFLYQFDYVSIQAQNLAYSISFLMGLTSLRSLPQALLPSVLYHDPSRTTGHQEGMG